MTTPLLVNYDMTLSSDHKDKISNQAEDDVKNEQPTVSLKSKQNKGRRVMGRQEAVSKALSKLLRHAAKDVGLKLDDEAFARLDHVLEWQRLKSLNVSFTDIKELVENDAKQRFTMKPNPVVVNHQSPPTPTSTELFNWIIRANQGHSINVDSSKLLMKITHEAGNIPDNIIHGTYFSSYPSIMKSGGLSRMTRRHIHFCTGPLEEGEKSKSGFRRDAEILIYVDVQASMKDGIDWWLSDNGVILTSGNAEGILSTKYFKRVIDRKGEAGVLWENGTEIKNLPELQEYKIPFGKSHRSNMRRSKNEIKSVNKH